MRALFTLISPLLLFSALDFASAVQTVLPHKLQPPTVRIRNGTVIGRYNSGFHQDFFLGIPFAQPPVGDLRFSPPQYISKAIKTINAQKYGKHCYGYGPDSEGFELSEDCLTLNIVRPAGVHQHAKLPVAVWIHGGGFFQGGAPDPRYNLTFLVEQSVKMGTPIIGVSVNYRMSLWGFISGREVAGTGNTNLGLRDQRMALHWVQENIQAFGGDLEKVTIFGESAGAMSVGFQLTAFGGRDDKLFRSAIMQSGSPVYFMKISAPESNQGLVDGMMAAMGCEDAPDKLQCLRGVKAEVLNEFLKVSDPVMGLPRAPAFQPVVDGDFVKTYGSQSLKEGKYVRVPTIIGGTADEGTAFTGWVPGAADNELGLQRFLGFYTYMSKNLIGRTLSIYNSSFSIPLPEKLSGVTTPPQLGVLFHRLAAIATDLLVEATKRFTAGIMVKDKVPVWTFRFKAVPNGSPPFIGATHFDEVAFVFNNVNGDGYPTNPAGGSNTAEYKKVADAMSKSWIRFIVTGNPSGGQGSNKVSWPKYKEGGGASQMVFDMAPRGLYVEKDNYRSEGISFINQYALQIGR